MRECKGLEGGQPAAVEFEESAFTLIPSLGAPAAPEPVVVFLVDVTAPADVLEEAKAALCAAIIAMPPWMSVGALAVFLNTVACLHMHIIPHVL